MKKQFLLTILVFLIFNYAKAQNAGEYMQSMSTEFSAISSDMWDYTSAVAHGKSARKVEKRRKEVLATNMEAQNKIKKLPPFENDKSLRDSILSYLKMSYHVINNDYGKIVDMEAIAEESYDGMEAYLLAQERANKKLDAAGDMIEKEQRAFAAKHNVTLNESSDKISEKLNVAGEVFNYNNKMYLLFFKPYKQEMYMLAALNKNDVNALKQNADALGKNAAEALKKLDTMKAFKGDLSVKNACKEMLDFYSNEATVKSQVLINFSVKKENFEKIKKAFDAKPQSARTKEDVDEYNKAVNDYNKATNEYNNTNQELNTKRSALLNKWNNATAAFTDKHVPKKK